MDIYNIYTTENPKETKKLGRKIGNFLIQRKLQYNGSVSRSKSGVIIGFSGELGSGKTTLIQGIAEGLGYESRVVSPTFLIMRQYHIPPPFLYFYHIDCYRTDSQGIIDIGLFDILQESRAVICIEWAEKIIELLPKNIITIECYVDNMERHVIKINNS
jgi:tRNA threonylcarbamoyladenosine biosynthesis protein TsaE